MGIKLKFELRTFKPPELLMPPIPTQPFLGFRLASFRTAEFIDALLDAAEECRGGRRPAALRVAYLNAATTNLAFESVEYARALAAMDCLYADGQAVVWAARFLGAPIAERINAGDFTGEFMRGMAARGLRLALVGGVTNYKLQITNYKLKMTNGGEGSEAARAAAHFREMAPGLDIVYLHHGYFKGEEAPRILQEIERADPDIILLGMGSPRQERMALAWAAAAGRSRVWWSVGALFEYYAGTRGRAPIWVRRVGLEWAWRLALEPRRLWRRYLVGNPQFVWRVFRRRPPQGLARTGRY